ncbi:MAG: hypothetical protein ABFD92_02150 [Planctomycetaceae bacterium]|nr:hypothetical protein [Planctomycetaceae bacterium]
MDRIKECHRAAVKEDLPVLHYLSLYAEGDWRRSLIDHTIVRLEEEASVKTNVKKEEW